jgi:hypothetical protein
MDPGWAQQRPAHRFNLPLASDLAADAVIARSRRIPVLLFFDRADCPYCERALREYLVPMSNDPAWRDRALYRQIEIDRALPLVGFDGGATTHRDLAATFRATLAPTVQVVDATGAPSGSAIVGLRTLDFYGAYLEDAVAAGLRRAGAQPE